MKVALQARRVTDYVHYAFIMVLNDYFAVKPQFLMRVFFNNTAYFLYMMRAEEKQHRIEHDRTR